MLDFERIMKDRGYWEDNRWVRTPKTTYTFDGGSKIEFLTVDTYGKAHGPRRDVLFVNECNNLSFNIVDQLIVRTREIVWLDWNPVSEFWFYTDFKDKRDDLDFITLTYLDNEALDEGTKKEIESRRERKGWWKVYGLGELGETEGKIYRDWEIIDEVPRNARLERYGLDFGYSNDPSALVGVYYYDGGYIWDEVIYQKGLSNKQIADVINNQFQSIIVADSAEPKSIDEIKMYGVNIIATPKGKDSVNNGIQLVQDNKISVTRRSVNIIKEYRNYLWETDKNGKILNKPEGIWNHAMDAGRYAMSSIIKQPRVFSGASPLLKPYYPKLGI